MIVYFQTPNPDLVAVQKRLVVWFKQHEFEVDSADSDGEYIIQARKGGNMRAFLGTSQAFMVKLSLSDEPNEFIFENTIGAWTSNLTGVGISAVFTGGITLLTGAAGAAWTVKVEREVVEYLQTSLKFRKVKEIDNTGNATALPSQQPGSSAVLAEQPSELAKPLSAADHSRQKAQDALKKLQAAHESGILDDDEFAKKKGELQAKAQEWHLQFLVQEKSEKLKEALENGLLEQHEYEAKLAGIEASIREQVNAQAQKQRKDAQIVKLKAALDAGILSEEEYAAKVALLG